MQIGYLHYLLFIIYMKRIVSISLVIAALILNGFNLFAQADKPYFSDDSHTVYVPKRTVIYPLRDYEAEKVQNDRYGEKWSIDHVNTMLLEKKVRVSESGDLVVVGFSKSGLSVKDYDFYIVEYSGQLCYLPKESCPDNSLIDSMNQGIIAYYQSMQRELEDLSEEYFSRVTKKAQDAASQLASIKERKDFLVDSISTSRIQQRQAEMAEEYNAWKANLNEVGQKASKYLVIHNSELLPPNSASGCDFSLYYTNTSTKTIKYLDWKGNAYNAVNDIVSCDVRNTSLLQGRETGPVAPDQEGGGKWETIIYNWSAKELRLTGITITYTDGTKVSLSGKEIAAIKGAPFLHMTYGQQSLIEINAKTEIETQIYNLEKISKYLSTPENARYETIGVFSEEAEIFKRIQAIGQESSLYRYRNLIPSWDDAPESVKRLIVIY